MDRYRMMPNYRFYDVERAYPLSLNKSVGKPLRDYKIYGNSIQDGIPTPENPVEIQSCGDKSKNLFDISKIESWDGLTNNKDGSLTVVGGSYYSTTTKKTIAELCPILKVGDVVTLSGETNAIYEQTGESLGQFYLYGSLPQKEAVWKYGTSKTVTQELLDSTVIIYPYRTTDAKNLTAQHWNMQIEYGEVATDYEPYGYKIPIELGGKNLFDEEAAKDNNNWSTSTGYKIFDRFVFQKGVHYTISMSDNLCCKDRYPFTSGQVAMCVNSKNGWGGVGIGNSSNNFYTKTKIDIYNETEDTYLVLYHSGGTKEEIFETMFPNMQIEYGEVATEYEPYKEPITTNIYLDEPLRKIGDYADYIDFKNKKVVRNIKRIYASEKIEYRYDMASGAAFNGEWVIFQTNIALKDVKLAYSNRFKLNSTYAKADYIFWLQSSGTYLTFNLKKTDIGATTDNTNTEITTLGRNYVENNPIYFDVIVEPTGETIEIPNIQTHKGTNIISVGTETPPSNIKVQYYK